MVLFLLVIYLQFSMDQDLRRLIKFIRALIVKCVIFTRTYLRGLLWFKRVVVVSVAQFCTVLVARSNYRACCFTRRADDARRARHARNCIYTARVAAYRGRIVRVTQVGAAVESDMEVGPAVRHYQLRFVVEGARAIRTVKRIRISAPDNDGQDVLIYRVFICVILYWRVITRGTTEFAFAKGVHRPVR